MISYSNHCSHSFNTKSIITFLSDSSRLSALFFFAPLIIVIYIKAFSSNQSSHNASTDCNVQNTSYPYLV